jgi:hypothetical protein
MAHNIIFMPHNIILIPVNGTATKCSITQRLRKAVNRGDKRTRCVRDRDFVIFERSRRYRDRYRCQEKKSRRGCALCPVFRDPPHAENETSIAVRGSRLPTPPPFLYNYIKKMYVCMYVYILYNPVVAAIKFVYTKLIV